MIKKVAMLATITAGLFMGANVAGNIPQAKKAELDTRIIIELDRSLGSLTDEGVHNVQNNLLNRIRSEVTSNFKVLSNYTVLNNAIGISVNNQYVNQITNLSGVKSVTVDKLHWFQQSNSVQTISVDPEHDYGGSTNISAETMNKPDDTNDGEGTLIAVLDNEFYFRAKHTEVNESGTEVVVDAWNHETFTSFEELEEDPVLRFKPVKKIIQGKTVYLAPKEFENAKHAHALQTEKGFVNTACGTEGSLYFNSKVPFYFDYGGQTPTYGDNYVADFDVSSLSDYHGSHVASTATGHSRYYKGIAPKAQLVAMKVFTEFRSTTFTEQMGLTSFSGAFEMPILNALEDAISLGVDGINMSLGSNLDDFDSNSITLRTLTRLSNAGILSAISAGNAGKTSFASLGGYANWTSEMVETGILSSYVNNHSTTSVASAQPTQIFYTQAFKVGDSFVAFEDQVTNREGYPKDFKVEHPIKDDLFPTGTETYEWKYIPGFGTSADYTGIDVRGKIAVVNRGSTSFADKYTVAKNMGAKALILINNDPTSNDFNFHCSFGDTQPEIPIVLVLFKDKAIFDGSLSGEKAGVLSLIENQIQDNEKAKTSSTFTSDGVAYDLELKPDISSPGDLIRGAVPPQNKDDKEARPLSSYAFLSGTSMAAPNYAGAQSVLLSKEAKKTYTSTHTQGEKYMSESELKEYRNTIDMRMLSTADPMYDLEDCPEGPAGVKTLTSPRIQGAGLVDLGGAYRTDVYLEGVDTLGNKTGKAKLSLKNNDDINSGKIALSFYSHNESDENRVYDAYLTVMRPAIKNDNGVVTKDYNYRGEIDDITLWAGRHYWTVTYDTEKGETVPVERVAPGTVSDKDYYKVSRDITYYATGEAALNADYDDEHGTWSCSHCGELHIPGDTKLCPHCGYDKDNYTEDFLTTIKAEKYSYEASSGEWITLPGYDYQSTQDVYIAERVPVGELTFAPGEQLNTLDPYVIDNDIKAQILSFYEYGCYLEGYLTLEAKQNGVENLNLVYVGFFAGEGNSYQDAPAVEPFNFEKDPNKVYPSDLVNDVAKTLVGKDSCDFGSTWIVGYVEPGKAFDTEAFEYNDNSLSNLAKTSTNWHFIGENPLSGEIDPNAKSNLYVGNLDTTNTMIIQQFVLRSCADNYFEIRNRDSGKLVYKSCLIDAANSYGYMGKWPLYKSHVNGDRLSSYIADKALAVVPLYDTATGEAFEDGIYDITFNYLLAGTNEWTGDTYKYTLRIDSSAPEVTEVVHSKADDTVRFYFEENNIAYAAFGGIHGGLWNIEEEDERQYLEVDEDKLIELLEDNLNEATDGTGRLFISFVDKAFGTTGVIVRFKYSYRTDTYDFDNYIMGQHTKLKINHDLIDRGTYVSVIEVNDGSYKVVEDEDIAKFTKFMRNNEVVEHIEYITIVTGGCGGNIVTTSVILSTLSLSAIILIAITRKKKKIGGK